MKFCKWNSRSRSYKWKNRSWLSDELIGTSELTENNYSPLGTDLMNGPIVQKSKVFLIDGPKPQSLGVWWHCLKERKISPHKLCVEKKKKPTRCHWMVYCAYNMLSMFRALLCPSSGARDYMCVITAYGVQCFVAGCWGSVQDSGLCVRHEGCYTNGQSCNIPHSGRIACCPALDLRQPATKALHTIGGNNTHIVSSSWWWA